MDNSYKGFYVRYKLPIRLLISTPRYIVVSRFKNIIKNQKRAKHNFKMYKLVKFYLITMPGILNVYWVLHNYVRTHFTTKAVPAVSLGIVERGLNLETLFSIQYL